MATSLKTLGQLSPTATILTDLYVVPASTSAVCSSIFVCNRSSNDTSFRIAVTKSGETTSDKHYIYYDVVIAGNDTFVSTTGITLAAGDKVSVYAALATLSFNLFGQENT